MSLRMAVIAALALTQGCATKDYVRETVDPPDEPSVSK